MQPQRLPSEIQLRSGRYRFRKLVFIVIIFVGVVSFSLSNFMLTQQRKTATSETIRNGRSLSFHLCEFEVEYGKFPDATTIASVRDNTESPLPLETKTSNDFFRQLIASGIVQSEIICFAEIAGAKKPDNRCDASHALEKGECGFSYIMGITSKDENRPLLVTPLIPGSRFFDPVPFNGYACVIFTNGDGRALPINEKGEAVDSSGKNILDPANPIWEGHAPVIAWPDL